MKKSVAVVNTHAQKVLQLSRWIWGFIQQLVYGTNVLVGVAKMNK